METTKKIALPFPTDAKLVQWMVKLIRETLGDFSEVEREYLLATSKSKLDTNLFNGINSIIDAWTTQIASEVLDPIIEYYIYLETVCPKLSHYFGYLIGDKLLYALEPGYSRSISVTIPYKILIHKLFGVYFDIL